jgi:hypothetical protein
MHVSKASGNHGIKRLLVATILTCILVFILLVPGYTSAPVINEVMSNVKGTDSGIGSPGDRNEFIELYNASDDTIDISLYRISDLDAEDEIILWTDSLLLDPDVIYGTTLLQPGGYAIILDPEYSDSGDGSYIQPYDFPSMTLIVTVGNTTIGDGLSTTDPIILLDEEGDTVSTYGTPEVHMDSIPFDPGDGISVERFSPFFPDGEQYWASSSDSSGSTPGTANSCYSESELTIPYYGFMVEPQQIAPGEVVTISAVVQNQTSDTVHVVNVDLFEDSNWDSVISDGEMITSFYIGEPLPPFGCTLRVETEWQPGTDGNKHIAVKMHNIEQASVFRMLKVGKPVGEIIINEIMYNPIEGGEWFELYNRSSHSIDLNGWKSKVGDDEAATIKSGQTVLNPGEYIVIVEDRSCFQNKWGNIPAEIIEMEPWIKLSNSEDSIQICNNFLFNFDKVCYSDKYESGVTMERINTDIGSNKDWNWGSCCDYRGGTPGERNSIYASSSSAKTLLTVNPNPFSPDDDGYQERTIISYELPFNQSKVNLSLYTRTGVRKCKFFRGKDSGKTGQIIWDGRDEKGKKLPVGLYIIYLEAVDKKSNKRVIQKKPAVIAGGR